ncbi:MAG: DNA polymerase III subunit delta, partial [Pseudomonadota bacterium]
AARFAKKPDASVPFVLIFGDDEGVVADLGRDLIAAWQNHERADVITLDEDEVKRDPPVLFDALEAVSLLGDGTILRLRTSGEKLFSILKDVLALAPERVAAKLIVQNGTLNTRSKIRTAFEAGANSAALQVFADSDADIAGLVRDMLSARDVAIEDDALAVFVAGLPGHRSLANAETEKLATYGYGLGRSISVEDVRALCETNADEDIYRAVQLALSGKADLAQAELDRVVDAGLSAIGLLRGLERETKQMLSARALQGARGGGNVGKQMKPPIWPNQWPAFEARLKIWPVAHLVRLLERIHDMEEMTKSPGGGGLADAAAREFFASVYQRAAANAERVKG